MKRVELGREFYAAIPTKEDESFRQLLAAKNIESSRKAAAICPNAKRTSL